MRWLIDDWKSRDPDDKLHDVEAGYYLSEIQNIPNSIRLLMQDGDMHVEVEEKEEGYRVTKIIKKREPEFLQARERFFVYGDDGTRIPLTEEEYDKLLGLEHNPEDLYETENIELETLNSEFTPPMDKWDIILDTTVYPMYSADYFFYPRDKRLHSRKAREIAAKIEEGITRRELGALLGPRPADRRSEIAHRLRVEAKKLMPCKKKAELLIKAQKLMDEVFRDRKKKSVPATISDSDRSKLWAMWREHEATHNGEVKLMPWQLERYKIAKPLQEKVAAGELTLNEAREILGKAIKENPVKFRPPRKKQLPEWLQSAKPIPTEEEDYEFPPTEWLPTSDLIEESPFGPREEHTLLEEEIS